MKLIDATNAEAYLRETGRLAADEPVQVRELAGGVSNIVLLVARPHGPPYFVLKQAREQLRVADPWFCSVTRIWREMEVLELCRRALSERESGGLAEAEWSVTIPEVLFCDRDNFLFAMTAAPPHEVWKARLLAGHCELPIAAACGRLLGALHAGTWRNAQVASQVGDRTFFEQLRIDPYYRHVARRRPAIAPRLEELVASLAEHPRCLVHGDFSPKNILVFAGGLMLVDCEVGHYGDPAFDIGFFLSHLVLKAFRAGPRWGDYLELTVAFWDDYQAQLASVSGGLEYASLVARGIAHLAGCLLARVDGKSKVDYLQELPLDRVRMAAEAILGRRPITWSEVIPFLSPSR